MPLESEKPRRRGIPIGRDRQAPPIAANWSAISSPPCCEVPSAHTPLINVASPRVAAISDERPARGTVDGHRRQRVFLDHDNFHAVGEPGPLERRKGKRRHTGRHGRRLPSVVFGREPQRRQRRLAPRSWPIACGLARQRRAVGHDFRGLPRRHLEYHAALPQVPVRHTLHSLRSHLEMPLEIVGQVAGVSGEHVVSIEAIGPAVKTTGRLQRPDHVGLEAMDRPSDLLGHGRLGLDVLQPFLNGPASSSARLWPCRAVARMKNCPVSSPDSWQTSTSCAILPFADQRFVEPRRHAVGEDVGQDFQFRFVGGEQRHRRPGQVEPGQSDPIRHGKAFLGIADFHRRQLEFRRLQAGRQRTKVLGHRVASPRPAGSRAMHRLALAGW